MARVGKKQEELNQFVNWMRTKLGLDPIETFHGRVAIKGRVTGLSRFGATIPDPWHPSRTPMRNSGC